MRPLGPTTQRPLATLVGLALAGALLAGCGSDDLTAEDTAPTPSATTVEASPAGPAGTGDAGGEVASDQVAILSATAAGGTVSEVAVALKDDTAVQQFAGQFTDGKLGDEISSTVAQTDVPVGKAMYGAVVAIGCDVPPGVVVANGDRGVTITAQQVKAPKVECLAPVTSVGLVLVDE